MSLFKEQDDYILRAFQEQNEHDSDEDFSQGSEPNETLLESNTSEIDENPPQVLDDLPNVEKIIDLTSDGDTGKKVNVSEDVITLSDEDSILETSIQSIDIPQKSEQQILEDYDFTLNIRLDGTEFKQLNSTYKTPFKEAIKSIIDNLKNEGKILVVYLGANELSLEQSPESMKLRPGTILNALTLSAASPTSGPDSTNMITVKLQDGNRKHKIQEFQIGHEETMLKLKQLYAEKFMIDSTDRITLLFDGDVVGDASTPKDVDLEDDCVIDVMLN